MKESILKSFIKEIEGVINRIPKDLIIWLREIKKLKRKKDKKSQAKVRDYRYFYAFYVGKIMAYVYVIQRLNKGRVRLTPFAKKTLKKLFSHVEGKKPTLRKL